MKKKNIEKIGIALGTIFVVTIFIGMAFVPGLGVSEDNVMEKWMQDHTIKVNSTTTCKYEQGSLLIKEVYTGEELKERFGIEQFTKELKIPMEGKVLGMEEGEEKVFVTEKVTVLTSAYDPPHWWDYYEYPQWVWFKSGDVYEKRLPINLAWKNTTKDTAKSEILEEGWVDNPIQWTEYVYDPIDGWMSGDGVATHVVGIFGRYHANLWQMSDGNVVANAHHDTPVPHEADELEEAEELVAGFFDEPDDTEWRVYEDSYNLDNNVKSPYSNGWCTQIDYNPAIWYVPDNYTRIQWAVDNATAGDIIIVRDGTYSENVDVNKRLTIQSENGSANCIVQATNPEDHVFEVTADHVNIHGFAVKGATEHWNAGIYFSNVNHGIISNNNVSNNYDGIRLYSSSNNALTKNNVLNNDYGIEVRESNDNNISNNNVSNATCGIHLYCSSNNTLINNRFGNGGIFIRGDDLSYYNTHVIENNKLNGKPIYYYKNANAIKVPEDAGEVIIANCSEITVENITASLGFVGIELAYTNNSQITNNKLSNNYFGFYLYFSNENTLAYNNVSSNDGGIVLWYSNNNILTGNKASNNSYGFQLYYSSNNTLTRNNVSNNDLGISLFLSNITIYLNNFINSIYNLYSYDSANTWNSTELITYQYNGSTFTNYMGNYWDDYKEKYPDAEEIDGTGIWDTPYSIDSDNDTYPLVEPWENYFAPIEYVFDTGSPANPYPSIMGNHTGTIKPNRTITVSKLYTYPCVGTGGHTESIKLYENGTLIANGSWNGYVGDWHNITIRNLTGGTPYVTLLENHEYNYTIITGSYPQIHHNASLLTKNGWINCTQFTDANGKRYKDWIPAIRLFSG